MPLDYIPEKERLAQIRACADMGGYDGDFMASRINFLLEQVDRAKSAGREEMRKAVLELFDSNTEWGKLSRSEILSALRAGVERIS